MTKSTVTQRETCADKITESAEGGLDIYSTCSSTAEMHLLKFI